jgi:hypothetical protein
MQFLRESVSVKLIHEHHHRLGAVVDHSEGSGQLGYRVETAGAGLNPSTFTQLSW